MHDCTNIFIKGSDLGDEFMIDNMHCKFYKARDALELIKAEGLYDFSPLPAVSLRGKPVPPADYERRLSGATVLIGVTLTSEYFTRKGYQFYADIESIVILRPAKRTVALPPSKSPSKKRRFDLPDVVKSVKRKVG